MVDAPRPGGRRSWWLREALALEPPDLERPSQSGPISADVAIVGGGYTGLWSAWFLTELAPGLRVVLLEQDICGGGPSGRNGGFALGAWDDLPELAATYGVDGGVAVAKAYAAAVDEIGAWCEAQGVAAEYRKGGYLQVSTAPTHDRKWDGALELGARLGHTAELTALSGDEVRARSASPRFRGGIFMPAAATIQPAMLARGLRRVLLERGVEIHEGTAVTGVEARPAAMGSANAGAPVVLRTAGGEVRADKVVLGLNAWAAGWRWFRREVLPWSSYIVLTEPIPDRLSELGWTGGESISDARFTLHYFRTTSDGRIAFGAGAGRAGFDGRIGKGFTDDHDAAERAARGLRYLYPQLEDVALVDAWGGPIDITDDHQPYFGQVEGGRIAFGHGYAGNGVSQAVVGGRILAGLTLGLDDDHTRLPFVDRRPKRFPPEPFRFVGARLLREVILAKEEAEQSGRRAAWPIRELARLPRRLGYHLGPR
ncbi:MAG TPA: FAD-dependent oxidoreductase [Candidatus Eisenbacteria bacterium]|nr:FAD-dependent oxidoreductase [Candidatus Eisenbacteria bacterium]